MKTKKRGIFLAFLIILAGAALLLYPLISQYFYERKQDLIMLEYTAKVGDDDSGRNAKEFSLAQDYNTRLSDAVYLLADPYDPNIENPLEEEYGRLLNRTEDGIMAYLEIPRIDVNLPVYHGTDEVVLQKGIGHLKESSLPVGGQGTHAVLSGHTGLSGAKLLTDLDQIEEGDLMVIHTCGEDLSYLTDQIKIVEPYDSSELQMRPGEDLLTVVTCYPYGINSHRLLVRGRRVYLPKEEVIELAQEQIQTPTSSTWITTYVNGIKSGCGIVLAVGMIWLVIHIAKRWILIMSGQFADRGRR